MLSIAHVAHGYRRLVGIRHWLYSLAPRNQGTVSRDQGPTPYYWYYSSSADLEQRPRRFPEYPSTYVARMRR